MRLGGEQRRLDAHKYDPRRDLEQGPCHDAREDNGDDHPGLFRIAVVFTPLFMRLREVRYGQAADLGNQVRRVGRRLFRDKVEQRSRVRGPERLPEGRETLPEVERALGGDDDVHPCGSELHDAEHRQNRRKRSKDPGKEARQNAVHNRLGDSVDDDASETAEEGCVASVGLEKPICAADRRRHGLVGRERVIGVLVDGRIWLSVGVGDIVVEGQRPIRWRGVLVFDNGESGEDLPYGIRKLVDGHVSLRRRSTCLIG